MHVSLEAHNVQLSPDWKRQIERGLTELSDPRDPIISARSTLSYRPGEIPPAQVSLVINLRGKNIVVQKRGENVDATLKTVMDTVKREIRQFYALRTDRRNRAVPLAEVHAAALEVAGPGVEDSE